MTAAARCDESAASSTRVILARHGQTEWLAAGRSQGQGDPPLDERGRRQALALARALRALEPASVYASDLARAAETARFVAARCGVPLRLVPELREVDLGEWTGLTADEIDRRWPGALARWRAGRRGWLAGESYDEMAERAVKALQKLAADHAGETVAVVAHAGTATAVRARALGVSFAECRLTEEALPCGGMLLVTIEGDEILDAVPVAAPHATCPPPDRSKRPPAVAASGKDR